MKEFMVGIALVICVIVAGEMDRRSAEVTAQVVAESPKPITYTVKQDSPGLEKGYEPNPLPLTLPVSNGR